MSGIIGSTGSRSGVNGQKYLKNNKSYFFTPSGTTVNSGTVGNSGDKFKAPCDCKITAHGMVKVTNVVGGGAYNQLEVWVAGVQYTNNWGDSSSNVNQYKTLSSAERTFSKDDEVMIWTQVAYGPSYGSNLTLCIEITPI